MSDNPTNPVAPGLDALQSLFATPVSIALKTPGDYLAELSQEERAQAQSMGSKRLLGYTAGRAAAKQALAQLGLYDAPVLIGEKRKPVWPAGIRGSISHCNDQCIAVVSPAADLLGVGVDVEQLKSLSDGVQGMIMTETELQHIQTLDASVPWGCVIFSIKECVYKCLNPVNGKWIDFHQAEVELAPDQGKCRITLDPAVHSDKTRKATLTGRFLCTPSHVYSAVTLH